MAPTKFIAVNLTPAARDRLRVAALRISLEAGRKVSMADALLILANVAEAHPEEITTQAAAVLGSGDTGKESEK